MGKTLKKCEKYSKFNEKIVKKVAAASCCAVFGRNGEGKRDERQTESRRKLDLTKGERGRRMDLLTKRKFPSTADGSAPDGRKTKRPKLDLVFSDNTKQEQYYQTNRKTLYNFHCNNQNQHKIQIYYYKTNPKRC